MSTNIGQLRAHARDMEAGERGYYLTGDERFLAPLKLAGADLGVYIRKTRALEERLPRYRPEIERIIRLIEVRYAEATEGVLVKRRGTYSGAQFAQRLLRSQDTMDDIRTRCRAVLSSLDSDEMAILNAQNTFSKWSFLFFSAGSLIMIGVIVWLYNVLLRYLYERDTANENLKTANNYLEARIEERTRDLTQANQELQQFAYVASHDLQEPLRTITSFSQLLALRYRGKLGCGCR